MTRAGKADSLKCPEVGCGSKISEGQLKGLLTQEDFKKYQHFFENAQVVQSKLKKFCPYPECENVIVEVTDPKTKEVNCHQCKRSFCF